MVTRRAETLSNQISSGPSPITVAPVFDFPSRFFNFTIAVSGSAHKTIKPVLGEFIKVPGFTIDLGITKLIIFHNSITQYLFYELQQPPYLCLLSLIHSFLSPST